MPDAVMEADHVRQPTVGFPAATSRLYTAGSTQHDRPAGLGPPGYQPCSPNHPSTPHSPTAAVAALSLVDLDLCVSPSLSSLHHRQCEPCSCHISMGCEHMQARAGVGRRNVRRVVACGSMRKAGVARRPRKVARMAMSLSLPGIPTAARARILPGKGGKRAHAQAHKQGGKVVRAGK